MSSSPRHWSRHTAVLARLGLLLMTVAVLAGCQRGFQPERVPRMRWLVMPIEPPAELAPPAREVRGWWFGARTIRQNPRAASALAETVSRRLTRLEYIHQFSPIDLRYYFADKRDRLTRAFPQLADDQIDGLLGQTPPLEFARELGADKLLTVRIIRHWMGENRTIHWWWSVLDAEAQVVDVRTGQPEWTRSYELRRQLASTATLQEEFAEQLTEDLQRHYFRPLAQAD